MISISLLVVPMEIEMERVTLPVSACKEEEVPLETVLPGKILHLFLLFTFHVTCFNTMFNHPLQIWNLLCVLFVFRRILFSELYLPSK